MERAQRRRTTPDRYARVLYDWRRRSTPWASSPAPIAVFVDAIRIRLSRRAERKSNGCPNSARATSVQALFSFALSRIPVVLVLSHGRPSGIRTFRRMSRPPRCSQATTPAARYRFGLAEHLAALGERGACSVRANRRPASTNTPIRIRIRNDFVHGHRPPPAARPWGRGRTIGSTCCVTGAAAVSEV